MNHMRRLLMILAVAIGCLLAACAGGRSGEAGLQAGAPLGTVEIAAAENLFRFDPATLELDVVPGRTGTAVPIAAPVRTGESYRRDGDALRFVYPDLGVSVRLEPEGSSLRILWSASGKASLDWPRIDVPEKGFFILPRGEGSYVPANDPGFRAYLAAHEMDTLADLNMPFWGIERPGSIVTCVLDNPFYNRIAFRSGRGMTMSFTHEFPAIDSWRSEISFRFFVDGSANRLAPAEHFRRIQERDGGLRTLSQKAADLPRIQRLIGAPHAYLWSEGPITEHDILPGAAKAVAALLLQTDRMPEAEAAAVRSILTSEDRENLRELSTLDTPYAYLRMREAEILSKAWFAGGSFVRTHVGAHLRPRNEWGGGISTRMIGRLKRAGFDKFLLVVSDRATPEANPEVAAYAEKNGYLFGTYDSYDSIHDPRTAGSDDSWPTAQFDEHLFMTGRMTDASGTQLRGFKGIGFWLSPVAARSAATERVERNFSKVPYSYSFIDCDAFGQYYDDFTPSRMASQSQDAGARVERLGWVSSAFKVPVGSEGGSYLFSRVLEVAEGINVPVMGWGDPLLTSKDSRYFVGRYYPPSGPEIFFTPVPLPEKYYHLFIDPRFRLPLYQAVFHDSVISTPHWASSSRKFTTTRKTQAIIEILYQAAPLYHLNFATSDAELGAILRHAKVFQATHEYTWRYAASGFERLDAERLVQRVHYGEMIMTANFGAKPFAGAGAPIPAGSVRIEWPDGGATTYEPDD